MAKAATKEESVPKKWGTKYLTVWDEAAKVNVSLTLSESVQDTVKNWGNLDYGVDSLVYEEDPQGVKSMMKKLGYYPLDRRSGPYYFQHYTNKKKEPNG